MANIKSFPNNQDVFIGAEDVMKWLHGRTSGVFGAAGNASVQALSSAAMAVTVSDGTGWISNDIGDGVVWWNDHEKLNGEKLTLNIDAADGVLNRIDRVIVEWETTNYVAYPQVKILKGAVSSNAVAPSLTNNSTKRQISLARIAVRAGTTAIESSMITDERLDSAVCGIVTDAVTADTTMFNAQMYELIEQLEYSISQAIAGGIPAHAMTHAAGGADPLTPDDIGAFSSAGGTVNGQTHFNAGVGFGGSIYTYGNMVLSHAMYGDTLPLTGVEGQIFFLRS